GGIRDVARIAIDEAMNSIVETPGETAEDAFGIKSTGAISPAGEDHLLLIGNAVAIGILVKEQIRRGCDKHAAVITMNGGGPSEALREHSGLVEAPVAVGVLQPSDLS